MYGCRWVAVAVFPPLYKTNMVEFIYIFELSPFFRCYAGIESESESVIPVHIYLTTENDTISHIHERF